MKARLLQPVLDTLAVEEEEEVLDTLADAALDAHLVQFLNVVGLGVEQNWARLQLVAALHCFCLLETPSVYLLPTAKGCYICHGTNLT